ncbi:HNH endonuclease family protein [Staphylococcus aureus subsp. aureus CIGC348]|nr:HNH endonuclease family protein [Staphylococcus aureus subsp. aureus CIGC348]
MHHIVYLDNDFNKALDLNNLMSVCHACHNKIHANDNKKAVKTKIKFVKI